MGKMKRNHENDFRLANKYISGDADAGHVLYANIFNIVMGFIDNYSYAKTLSQHDKDDIMAETLKISIDRIEYYNGDCAFSTYVCGIAKNKIREMHRQVIKDISMFEFSEEISIFDDPLDILIKKECRETVQSAFSNLSPKQSDVLNMVSDGMSMDEVAVQLKCSKKAVFSAYYRGIKSMQEKFKNNF